MKILLDIDGMSQYGPDINEPYRNSACGPVTAAVILNYHSISDYTVNDLYKRLGTTLIGLSKWGFIRKMRKLFGKDAVSEITIEGVKKELCAGRPVAAKFDRYFSFKWRQRFDFSYHWVPVIGFEEIDDELFLFVHDNGGRNRKSQIRRVSYEKNSPILSFVRVEPLNLS